MITLIGDEAERLGYTLLIILQSVDTARVENYDPVVVPVDSLNLHGPCRGIEITYVKPEDEKAVELLGQLGDFTGIARLVCAGFNPHTEPVKRVLYRKLTERIQ